MLYKKLYKLNTNNTIQVWEIHKDDKSYWTVSGKLDGKMTTTLPTFVEAKQTRTLDEQIDFMCESQISKKVRQKYVDDITDVHKAEETLIGYSAQLAHKYDKNKHKIIFPCATQPKLDGIRCLITKDGMFSRGRKEFSSCQHIMDELKSFFEEYPTAKLDGELYTHDYKDEFESIVSAVKKTASKATPEDLIAQKKIKYHIYDAPIIGDFTENDKFMDRQQLLSKLFCDYENIVVVDTRYNINTHDEIETLKKYWLDLGYEGVMIRNIDSPYEGKRSYNLLKYKTFIDDEFLIIDIIEGKGNLQGCAGSFLVKDNISDSTFNAKLDGSVERLKYLFNNRHECVGKMATISYQGRTVNNIVRFPTMKSIRGLVDKSDWL